MLCCLELQSLLVSLGRKEVISQYSVLYICVKELGLGGEWEVERIPLKPCTERRNFLLCSYLEISKDPSNCSEVSFPLTLSSAPLWSTSIHLHTISPQGDPSGKFILLPLSLSFTEAFSSYQEFSAILEPPLPQRCELKKFHFCQHYNEINPV